MGVIKKRGTEDGDNEPVEARREVHEEPHKHVDERHETDEQRKFGLRDCLHMLLFISFQSK